MERIEFVRLAASRARLAFEHISADSVCPHRCIRVGGGAGDGDGDGDGDGARAGDRLAVASTVLAHHACPPSALPIKTPEEDHVLGEEITRQQAFIQTENPKAQASADLTLNLTKAQLLGWLAGQGLDSIDHHGDANVPTTLMSLLDHPDPTRVDSAGEIPAGKITYAPSCMSLTVATIVNSVFSFVSAACRAMLLCLAKGILLTFLIPFWVLDWNGDGAKVGRAGRAARASH